MSLKKKKWASNKFTQVLDCFAKIMTKPILFFFYNSFSIRKIDSFSRGQQKNKSKNRIKAKENVLPIYIYTYKYTYIYISRGIIDLIKEGKKSLTK